MIDHDVLYAIMAAIIKSGRPWADAKQVVDAALGMLYEDADYAKRIAEGKQTIDAALDIIEELERRKKAKEKKLAESV